MTPVAAAQIQAYRASILYFTGDPSLDANACVWHQDGMLLIENGLVRAVGDADRLLPSLPPDVKVIEYRGKIICPGFIDTHVHFCQTDIIASPAPGLLPWLETYTFPAEAKFVDPVHGAEVAKFFLDQLLSCGTTSAMVYCTVHPASVEAFFTASESRNMRMVAGKVLMDRNCPEYLRDTAEQGIRDSEALIKTWHGRGRQSYAITPRFAPTSSPAQLQLAGELAQQHPTTFIQSHLAENVDEIAWVKSLFPHARSYLDVYEKVGLLRERAMYGHCIWLDHADRTRMAHTGAAVAMCPTSNLFLGSGLFDIAAADRARMMLSLATDVGGGTSMSMLQTMDAMVKVARLTGHTLSAQRLFYLATLGGARAMCLDGTIGSLSVGAEADFIVLDPMATPLLARRTAQSASLEELLFTLAILGDDRAVLATYIAGALKFSRART